jgi:hypothetical protein
VVREYLEQLAGQAQLNADVESFMQSARATPGRLRGWKFDRDEIHERS